jgi:NAD(P)-dependent dehydrogenase (short-subunit alcohol dehydrogenase family)
MPSTADDVGLRGKTIVITGASGGLGKAAALRLGALGAELAIVGRNPERTREVAAAVGGSAFVADFDSLAQVRSLADALLARYARIDVLANNAGGLTTERSITEDGFERTIQANHLAPFLLTALLLPALTASGGRVISTASNANLWTHLDLDDLDFERRRWLGGWPAYGASKVATILFIRELARRTMDTGVAAYSFHPGFVATGFGAEAWPLKLAQFVGRGHLGISPEQGGAPLVHLAAVVDVPAPSGTYFDGLKPDGHARAQTRSDDAAARLWEISSRLVGLPGNSRPE